MSPQTFASGQGTTASSSHWVNRITGKPSPTERRSSSLRAWSRSLESTPPAASPPFPTLTSASLIRSSAEPRGELHPHNPPLTKSPLHPADLLPLRADLQSRHRQLDHPSRIAPPTRPLPLPPASMAAAVPARTIPELPHGAPCPRMATRRQQALLRASTRRGIYAVKILLCASGWRPTT